MKTIEQIVKGMREVVAESATEEDAVGVTFEAVSEWADALEAIQREAGNTAPQPQVPEGHMVVPIRLVKSIAYTGVDFGYGPYQIGDAEIEEARKLIAAAQESIDE